MNPFRIHSLRLIAPVAVLLGAACSDPTATPGEGITPREARQTTSGPTVTSTVPAQSERGTTLDVRVLGSGFDNGTTARWAIDGVPAEKVVTNRTTYVSSKEIVANITIAPDADVTFYDVLVTTTAGKPGIGTEKFEVTIQVTRLGSLESGQTEALAINESGQIAGYSGSRAFLWENGVMKDLGLPPGFTSSRAEGINNLGQVVGYAMRQVDGVWNARAWLWKAGEGLTLLPGSEYSTAYAINDLGMIGGRARRADGSSGAAAWIDGVLHIVPGLSTFYDINVSGEAVASGAPNGGVGNWQTAYVWSLAAGLRPVPTLYSSAGEPLGINDSGQVVGWGPTGGVESLDQAFVSTGTSARNLGLPGVSSSGAHKIANNGFIVGRYKPYAAALWLPDGSLVKLPTGLASGGNTDAYDVNSGGQAVGAIDIVGRRTTTRVAVRWSLY